MRRAVLPWRFGPVLPPGAKVLLHVVVMVAVPISRGGWIDGLGNHWHRLHAYRLVRVVNGTGRRGRWRHPLSTRDLGYAGAQQTACTSTQHSAGGPANGIANHGARCGANSRTYDGAQLVGMAAMAGDKQCCADQSSQRAGKPTWLR